MTPTCPDVPLTASMGSGRGDRNQSALVERHLLPRTGLASMGSGRGDRNQTVIYRSIQRSEMALQWGPVVVTGIRARC